jgi:hypothetical protein
MTNLRVVGPAADPFGEQETTDQYRAFTASYNMVELWTKDGRHVERMLYGNNRLEKAWDIFEQAVKYRPRGPIRSVEASGCYRSGPMTKP